MRDAGCSAVATRLNGFFIPESYEVGKPRARSTITDNVYSSGGHGRSLDQDPVSSIIRSWEPLYWITVGHNPRESVRLRPCSSLLLNHAVQRRNTKSQRMKLTPQMFVFLIPQSLSQHISSAKSSERLISY